MKAIDFWFVAAVFLSAGCDNSPVTLGSGEYAFPGAWEPPPDNRLCAFQASFAGRVGTVRFDVPNAYVTTAVGPNLDLVIEGFEPEWVMLGLHLEAPITDLVVGDWGSHEVIGCSGEDELFGDKLKVDALEPSESEVLADIEVELPFHDVPQLVTVGLVLHRDGPDCRRPPPPAAD